MQDNRKYYFKEFPGMFFPGLLSALIHALSFPNILWGKGSGMLSLFALVPVLYAAFKAEQRRGAFLSGLTYGSIAYALTVSYYFGNCFTGLYFALVVWNGLFYGLMCVIFRTANARKPSAAPFVTAVILVAYQYLFISRWWLGTYIGFLPYALYEFPVFTQILDITGVHGLFFIMVLSQATLAGFLAFPDRKKLLIPAAAISVGLLVFQIVYGTVSLDRWKKTEPDSVLKLGVIQPNCGDYDSDYGTEKGYERLRRQLFSIAEENPDLIVTSETAFTYPLAWYIEHPVESSEVSELGIQLYYDMLQEETRGRELLEISRTAGIPIIVGNPDLRSEDKPGAPPAALPTEASPVNRVSLIEDGKITDIYDKVHLAPVVETLPFNDIPFFAGLYRKAGLNLFRQGREADPIEVAGLRIGTPVCFEGHFPYLCSAFGADLFISPGSNSYDRVGWGQLHDAMISSFRAIENRRTYVRIFNTGLSCVFTPWGEMKDRLETNSMTETVWEVGIYNRKKTLYSLAPDFLGIAASSFTAAYLLMLALEKKRRKR